MNSKTPHAFPAGGIGGSCLCNGLRRAARSITRLYDAALAPSGLRATQFSILAAAAARGPVPLGRMAEALATERTTLTRNLDLLEKRGLVADAPRNDGADRRERLVEITPAGRAALDAAIPFWTAAQEEMRQRLGADRFAAALSELSALADLARP